MNKPLCSLVHLRASRQDRGGIHLQKKKIYLSLVVVQELRKCNIIPLVTGSLGNKPFACLDLNSFWYNDVLDHKLPLEIEFLRLQRQLLSHMIRGKLQRSSVRDGEHPYKVLNEFVWHMVPGSAHVMVAMQTLALNHSTQ